MGVPRSYHCAIFACGSRRVYFPVRAIISVRTGRSIRMKRFRTRWHRSCLVADSGRKVRLFQLVMFQGKTLYLREFMLKLGNFLLLGSG